MVKRNITIKDVTLKNCTSRGIDVIASDNLTIDHVHHFILNKGYPTCNSAINFKITNNTLSGATSTGTMAGIDLSVSMVASNGVIANNIIHDYDVSTTTSTAYGIISTTQ